MDNLFLFFSSFSLSLSSAAFFFLDISSYYISKTWLDNDSKNRHLRVVMTIFFYIIPVFIV